MQQVLRPSFGAAVAVSSSLVLLCYVDEAGNEQVLDPACSDAAPVLVIAGLIFSESQMKHVVWEFLKIKKRFLRAADTMPLSELIKTEIKGSDLRADIRANRHRSQRRAFMIIDAVVDLLERYDVKLAATVWIKKDGDGLAKHAYADSVAKLAVNFQHCLDEAGASGIMILDSQTKVKNVPNVHGITTRKLRTGGDLYPGLIESPVFGHSDAHVPLQIADILVSGVLFPLACQAYCGDLEDNVHPHPNYRTVQERYGQRLRRIECRFKDAEGKERGGILVRDLRNGKNARAIFGRRSRQRINLLNAIPLMRQGGKVSEPK